jgi:glc operon protein GlcG
MNQALILKLLAMGLKLAGHKGLALSIALMGPDCQLAGFTRMEGSYQGSVMSSQEKARTACLFQKSTADFEKALQQGRTALLGVKEIVPIAGGIPLFKDKEFKGSIGISGATSEVDHQIGLEIALSL